MDRRELLKMIAVLTGATMVGGEMFLSGCTNGAKDAAGFSAANMALLDEVGETILPTTASSPGAKATQIAEYMKSFVLDCYTKAEQTAFINGIEELKEESEKKYKKGFMDLTPEQRHELLVSLEPVAKEFNKGQDEKDQPGRDEKKKINRSYDFVGLPKHYYTMMKQLTLWGYFSSKIGSTQALRHVAVPGKFDGAYPYKKGDKAWAE